MKKLKINKKIAVFIAALTLILSSVFSVHGFVVQADEGATYDTVTAYYNHARGEVVLASALNEEHNLLNLYDSSYKLASNGSALPAVFEEVDSQLRFIVACARYRNGLESAYPDKSYAGDNLKKVQAEKAEAFAKLYLESKHLASNAAREERAVALEEIYTRANESLKNYSKAFAGEALSATSSITFDYETATAVTRAVKKDNSSYDYSSDELAKQHLMLYTASYYKELTDIKTQYLEKVSNAAVSSLAEWESAGYAVYGGDDFYKSRVEEIEKLETEALAKMKAVPHNSFEYAYSLYEAYKGARDGGATEYEITQAENAAISPCRQAVNYYNGFSDELKVFYSSKYYAIENFLKGLEYNQYTPPESDDVSTLTDANGIITVTARYKETYGYPAAEARILPALGVLKISNVRNGAAKRNASSDIKALEKSLGVSYFLYVSVTNGSRADYELPLTHTRLNASGELIKDYDGSVRMFDIEYEVKIDLEKYYENTQSAQTNKVVKTRVHNDYGSYVDSNTYLINNANYDEKQQDKLDNIVNGYEIIGENAELSLCYLYEYGKDMTKLNGSIQKGESILMFTTTKLGMFCIAGSETENLLLNPVTWVAALAVIILLIIALKITLKHVRYGVKFVTNGGTPVGKIKAAKGEFFVMPSAPVKDGFVFGGWFSDKECTSRFIETHMRRRKGYKVYAKWVAPVPSKRLAEYYDELKRLMLSYEKSGYKSDLGVSEQTRVACVYGSVNSVTLYLALNPAAIKSEGYAVEGCKLKAFADVPTKMVISTEETFSSALELLKRAMVACGMREKLGFVCEEPASTADERALGYELVVKTDRVAGTAEDYFELLRVALKSYVLERDTGRFKPGDTLTLARIYVNDEVACLYMPCVKSVKELASGEVEPRFADTPVQFKVLAPTDLVEAYAVIDKLMTSFGFVKDPENAADLKETEVPATCGFAYTVRF